VPLSLMPPTRTRPFSARYVHSEIIIMDNQD
jgi:hypothetical protein